MTRLRLHADSEGDTAPFEYLALSGGGDNGAFGAGLLVGWTEQGSRPEFEIVTGISTGALIAPFAYLGMAYDHVLQSVYTSIEPEHIFLPRNMLAALFDDALADTTPLYRLIESNFNEEMLQEVASEWQEKGRALLIATTNLDAQRPVIWNMGAIASSGDPKSLELFRKILLASASIPGFFPPVMIDVEVDHRNYQEMHVDGGARVQTFFMHSSFLSALRERGSLTDREQHLYLVRNARLDPEWAAVDRRALTIIQRAIASLIQSQGIDDLFRIYLHAETDEMDFNLAFIGEDFDHEHEEQFDRDYMRALYDYGYQAGRQGYPWQKTPPNFSR